MGGSPTSLTGPDLEEGVPADSVVEGRPVVGHAFGEAVLLARHGEAIFAVSATCPHYGGPLGEGLQVGRQIRCPWHHAAFDLPTGALLRAPAIEPLTCYTVERASGQVRVSGKRPRRAAPARVEGPESVVIVGAGAAGHAAAETLRREGYAGPVTLIGADASEPYDRPNLSKDYLAGTAPEAWIPLRSREAYTEKRIDLRTGVRATGIDPTTKRVTLSDGTTLSYGALLLATGAEPIRLDVPGADLPHVHVLRSLADCRAIIAAARRAERVVVVGASFIGLEVAASLRARGLAVHVVAPEARPLERIMGPDVGDFLRALHEDNGVQFRLGHVLISIDAGGVTLDSGEVLPADLVVVGIGVRPTVELAESAGLALDRGVKVSAFLETSAPGIWAAGDIARWPDRRTGEDIRVEHWVVAQRQGQTAARNILGTREPFDAVPFFWTTQLGVTVSYVGHAQSWDRAELDGSLSAGDCTIRYRKGDRTLAVATVGRDAESLGAELEMESASMEQ